MPIEEMPFGRYIVRVYHYLVRAYRYSCAHPVRMILAVVGILFILLLLLIVCVQIFEIHYWMIHHH